MVLVVCIGVNIMMIEQLFLVMVLFVIPHLASSSSCLSYWVGDEFVCPLLTGGDVKCWGRNSDGQLGQEDNSHRGDNANELVWIFCFKIEIIVGIRAPTFPQSPFQEAWTPSSRYKLEMTLLVSSLRD